METQTIGYLSGDPWVEKKDILHRLYVQEKKTLPEVKAIMEREYGFRAPYVLSSVGTPITIVLTIMQPFYVRNKAEKAPGPA